MRSNPLRNILAAVALVASLCGGGTVVAAGDDEATSAAERERFFEARIRPVLVEHCHKCHGAKKQEGGLRLDSRASLLAGAESGKVVVPGRPEKSRLIEVVEYADPIVQMPPTGKLKAPAIVALRQWVRLGLPWPAESSSVRPDSGSEAAKSHWAFQPIRRPEPPAVKNASQIRTPIDRFVLAKLEARGLSFSPEADRPTLIRRATFDLLGLPPTPEEVADFVADESPAAFERVVDRLLASPHYGERWGRHWLDVARYADNKGYVFFEEKKFPWAYTYRDFVIRALNEDLPFDRFVLYQLAADQLVGDQHDKRPLAAMGFLTLGGRFMNNAHDVLDDRIDVVSRGLLGLTVTCSRCHDHKFDPITQEDYYALYGVFRSSIEPLLPPLFAPPPNTQEYRKFDEEMQQRMAKLREFIDAKHAELVADGRKRAAEYLLAAYARRNQPSTEDFMLLVPAGDLNPKMILRWQLHLENARKSGDPVWTVWHALADSTGLSESGSAAEEEFAARAAAVLSRITSQGAIAPDSESPAPSPVNRLVRAAFSKAAAKSMQDVAERYAGLLASIQDRWQAALKSAEEQGREPPERLSDPDEEELRQVFYGPAAPPEIPKTLGWGFLDLLPDRPAQEEFKKLLKAVEEWSMTGPDAPPRAMVLFDAERPYQPRVFQRGNPNRPGQPVARRFLRLLDEEGRPFEQGSGRLELARAIVDPQNPLTARVIVGRVWLWHFGRGLVGTPSDFGLRSEPPSHPELLDFLAADFVARGWSIKRLHRQIMLSNVYRQTSHPSMPPAGVNEPGRVDPREIDPENRLLWRSHRRRLDFETMRDSLLAVSSTLDRNLYGPPVDLFGGYVPRRTVYGFVDRMDLPGLLRAFDFPSPSASSPQRTSTTVPPQALFLMNNEFVVESARRVLRRSDVVEASGIEARVEQLYRALFGREESPEELSLAREFLGDKPTVARWTQYAHGLLLTNEFVFVD